MRVLSVGQPLPFATESVGWNEEYNIKDYDVVFLNLQKIADLHRKANARSSSTILEFTGWDSLELPSRQEASTALATDTDIVATLPDRRTVDKKPSRTNSISVSLLKWIKPELNLRYESGESVNPDSIDDEWQWYFDTDSIQWWAHLYSDDTTPDNSGLKFSISSLVLNGYNRALAAQIDVSHSGKSRGSIFLVPLLENWSYQDFASNVFQRVILDKNPGEAEQESSPEWVENYSVPGEKRTQTNIDELESEIEELKEQKREAEAELDELQKFKRLLYQNGDPLEDIVPETLRELGLSVEGELENDRDALIHLDSTHIAVETYGTTKGVKREKCRQLDDWVQQLMLDDEQEDIDYTGLLIVNPLRRKDPEDRNGFLTPNVEKFMNRRGYQILTTPNLFELFVAHRRDEIDTEDIVELLEGDDTKIEVGGLSEPSE
jgi:prefoldin subunit 5